MAGPWEKYAEAAPAAGPWEKYGGQRTPTPADIPSNAPYAPTTPQDVENARQLGAPPTNNDNGLGRLRGSVEPLLTVGSGLVGQIAGNLAGVAKSATSGKFGTQEGARIGKAEADRVAAQMTYEPRTDSGRAGLRAIATLAAPLEGLQGIGGADAVMAGRIAQSSGSAVRNLATANAGARAVDDAAAAAGGGNLRDLIRNPDKAAALAGVGAARSTDEVARVAAANQLPVPMGGLMTKGMRTRAKPDLAFENIAAKDPETGAGLRNRTVEINQAALQNFDAFANMTGAEGAGLRATGKVVDDYLIKRVRDAKAEIRQAYDDAAASVEGKTPANYKPLSDYVARFSAEAETGNAPVLNAVTRSLEKLDPDGTGVIPLRDYNEIREMVGRISKDGTPNAAYRKDLQKFIDDAVEQNGGPLYRSARRNYENYQNEFKNAGAIDKLLRMKPGTEDRATALEDFVDSAVLKAPSTDAVRQFRSTMTKKQDPAGLQAWREVQGETARQIKERVTTASALNEGGAREVSPAALDKIIRELDADGRLDVIFTKQGAQQWRDLRDTVIEMKTIPVGTVSTSGTAEVLLAAMDTVISGMSGLPLPVGTALNYGAKRIKKKRLVKRVNNALNPDGETP